MVTVIRIMQTMATQPMHSIVTGEVLLRFIQGFGVGGEWGGAVLLVAEAQTAGRGRLGRSWASQPGVSLTFSLGLPLAPADWSGLSLVVGVSVAQSLHPQLQLKWPNDVWLQDRKLGGILIETATTKATTPGPAGPGRQVVIGVGLNLAPREGAGRS